MKVLILLAIFIVSYSKTFDICDEQKTCEDCIKKSNDCIWCSMDNINDHCKSRNSNLSSWCLENRIDPRSIVTVEQDLNFSSELGKFIQIKPQKIKLDLRPGQRLKFDISFKNAKDYPVDIYFLLDGSISMASIKNETAFESEKVYKQIKTMTSNVYLGMGTFVDKNALPFTSTKNSTLTYSFKNHLKLTDEFEVFKKVMNDTPFGFNFDEQEGTLDALAQVIVCKEEIGWRNESRKIIVVQTMSPYHSAGDGIWAGIVKPNDGRCYTKNGVYTNELEMDYPSISLINKLASDEQVTIIFAVNSDMYNVYKALSDVVTGSKTPFDFKTLDILRSIYEEITSNLKIRVIMQWDYRNFFKITTNPDCLSESNNNNECQLKQGEEKKIEGSIELLENIPGVNDVSIDLMIEGLKEKLNLNINLINKCNCFTQPDSPACSFEGKNICGVCECNNGRWGDKCQCSVNNSTVSLYDKTSCQDPNTTAVCNGHGFCYCGACVCSDRYEGRYCECNKDSCPRDQNGALCSDHGECQCGGRCKCSEGWSGDVCSCVESVSPCIEDEKICHNRGSCTCGSCGCPPIAPWDARNEQTKHCRVLPCDSCHSSQCILLKECAMCKRNDAAVCPCHHFNVTVVKNITEDQVSYYKICPSVNAAIGCDMKFGYKYATDQYSVDIIVQSDLDCAKSYYMYGGGVLAGLLAIGITSLLLWKLISDAKDKREYKRFLNEVANSYDACDNPLYAAATTTFNNPAFRKRSIKE